LASFGVSLEIAHAAIQSLSTLIAFFPVPFTLLGLQSWPQEHRNMLPCAVAITSAESKDALCAQRSSSPLLKVKQGMSLGRGCCSSSA